MLSYEEELCRLKAEAPGDPSEFVRTRAGSLDSSEISQKD